MDLQITWHGHACFSLTWDGYTLLLDPYEDYYVPGLAPLTQSAHTVLCSHSHNDHSARDVIPLFPERENPFSITKIQSFHDPEQGRLRGENTIHLIQRGSLRLAHFGDFGTGLTPSQVAELGQLDAIMLPIGGYYTIGPKEAADLVHTIKPRVVFPMHYKGDGFGFDVLATIEDFVALCPGAVFYSENHCRLSPHAPEEISVLSCREQLLNK